MDPGHFSHASYVEVNPIVFSYITNIDQHFYHKIPISPDCYLATLIICKIVYSAKFNTTNIVNYFIRHQRFCILPVLILGSTMVVNAPLNIHPAFHHIIFGTLHSKY